MRGMTSAQHKIPPSGSGETRQRFIHVIQGESAVSSEPGAAFATVLGSCIATCMRDPVLGIGGMNHFLLPGTKVGAGSDDQKYGVYAMECLINGLLKAGAMRHRLEAKIFGGANVVDVSTNIGEQNAKFVQKFLSDEGIAIVGQSVGGDRARRLRYWPSTGEAKQLLLDKAAKVPAPVAPKPLPPTGDIELF